MFQFELIKYPFFAANCVTIFIMILERLPAVTVAEWRMSYFVAGLTNDNPNIIAPVYKQYHHVQYSESLPASATASVSFPPSAEMFRYVIIQQQFDVGQAICMAEVKVFLRGISPYRTSICA